MISDKTFAAVVIGTMVSNIALCITGLLIAKPFKPMVENANRYLEHEIDRQIKEDEREETN